MNALFQDAVVTLAALGAAWVIVRRLVEVVQPSTKKAPACPGCSTGACEPPAAGSAESKPLQFIR